MLGEMHWIPVGSGRGSARVHLSAYA
jgi:hypothetical protein